MSPALICRPELLRRSLKFAAHVLVFTEQSQPERFPLRDVGATQHCLIDSLIAVIEAVFERRATGIEGLVHQE